MTLFVTYLGASVVVVVTTELDVVGASVEDVWATVVTAAVVGAGVVGAATSPPDEHATSARQHAATTVAFTICDGTPGYKPMVCAILLPTASPSAKPWVLST